MIFHEILKKTDSNDEISSNEEALTYEEENAIRLVVCLSISQLFIYSVTSILEAI